MVDLSEYAGITEFLNQWDEDRANNKWPAMRDEGQEIFDQINKSYGKPAGEWKRVGNSNGRRQPNSSKELWAWAGIAYLANLDGDRASAQNGVGFSKIDGEFGHSLAQQQDLGWTDKQFQAALRICRRYSKTQLSPEPV